MAISSDMIRGYTDVILLTRLADGRGYGYEINRTVRQKTSGRFEFNEATLYTAFRRLEQAGCIVSFWGDETTGARRRYYAITPKGRETLERLREEWRETKETIDLLSKGTERGYKEDGATIGKQNR